MGGDSKRSIIIWIFREPWTYACYATQYLSIWLFETISTAWEVANIEFFVVRISPYSVQIRINTYQKKHRICTLFAQCYCNIISPENGEFNRWVCWKTYCYVKAIETSIHIKSMGACKRWIKLLVWFITWVSFWCLHIDHIVGKKQCV